MPDYMWDNTAAVILYEQCVYCGEPYPSDDCCQSCAADQENE